MSQSAVKLHLIVAVCEGGGIGAAGSLPWKLKSELRYFAKMTKSTTDKKKKNAVLMGRKTWESIPDKFRPLRDRVNIVLSRSNKVVGIEDRHGGNDDVRRDDVIVCPSFKSAVAMIDTEMCGLIETCWVIGGSSVYQEGLNNDRVERVYRTDIQKRYDCDTYMEELGEEWTEVEDERVPQEVQEEEGVNFRYRVFQRRAVQ